MDNFDNRSPENIRRYAERLRATTELLRAERVAVPLSERVIRIREAYKRFDDAEVNWVESVLAIGRELWEARQQYQNNQEFSVWLAENEIDKFGHQDRAALIQSYPHQDLFRTVVVDSKSTSIQLIWGEMQRRLTSASKTAPEPSATPEIPESPAVRPDIPPSATPELAKPVAVKTSVTPPSLELARTRSPLRDYPKFELWNEYVLHSITRSTWTRLFKERRAKGVWPLLIKSIESGAYGPPGAHSVTYPTLRLILPWAPQAYADRYDLTTLKDRELVTDVIFPVIAEHRDEILAKPERLRELIDTFYAKRQAEAHAKRTDTAVKKLPGTEQKVVAYGVVMWPDLGETPPWTYAEICHAMWFFEFTSRQFRAEATAKGRALQIRQMLSWVLPAHDSGWSKAVARIAFQYERSPEAPCEVPSPPVNYRHGLETG